MKPLLVPWAPAGHLYDADHLRTLHNHEFMNEPTFQAAYARGVQATGLDYQWYWRLHVGLWAAQSAVKLQGDFIECGVAKGFMSSAIMRLLDWNKTGKTFYLLDTFSGTSDAKFAGLYASSPEPVMKNFAEWRTVRFIVGTIPETLNQIDSKEIAFLHVDMNSSPPEIAALEHLWDALVPGALVLLDDYAYHGYRPQKLGVDAFAASKNVHVLSMPTGQGLLLKPPKENEQPHET